MGFLNSIASNDHTSARGEGQGGVHVAEPRPKYVAALSIKNAFIFKIRATYLKISRAFGAGIREFVLLVQTCF